jgi:hypothetical protein
MTATTLDPAKIEAFGGKMVGMLNQGFLALLVSIGHETRLFDRMASLPPSTSDAIARTTGLQERYVREWLGGMVVGGIVEYDPKARTYRLPGEHAALLTRDAGTNNLAFFAQYVPLTANVYQQVVDCFRRGGGVPYSAYPTSNASRRRRARRSTTRSSWERSCPWLPVSPSASPRGSTSWTWGAARATP